MGKFFLHRLNFVNVFFLKGDQNWVMYSILGQKYILNTFVIIVAELVLELFDI